MQRFMIYNIVFILIIIAVILIILFKNKSTNNNINYQHIDKKLYVGYIPSVIPNQLNAIVFEINYTVNTVATITSGYSISEIEPSGNILDTSFNCVFEGIVQGVKQNISFVKNTDLTYTLSTIYNNKNTEFQIQFYDINDIIIAYNIFLFKTQKPVIPSINKKDIYIGYVGVSDKDITNIMIFQLDTLTNMISTISKNFNVISQVYSSGNTEFTVNFENSFLSNDQLSFSFKKGNITDFYTVTTSIITFTVQKLDINDITKIYSSLLNETSKFSIKKQLKYKLPNKTHKKLSEKYIKEYQITQLTHTDFLKKKEQIQYLKTQLNDYVDKLNTNLSANKGS